jgi:Domain of unknown function (DUF4148)
MKSLIQAIAVAAVLTVPAVSFAQSNGPVTRAEVRAQLVQLEKAGYNPAVSDNTTYPADIQKAEARVAAENGAATSYGGVAEGSSASSGRAAVTSANNGNAKSIYFGH